MVLFISAKSEHPAVSQRREEDQGSVELFLYNLKQNEEFKHLRLSENVDPSGSLVIACMVTWLPW